jgi:hypothetical protein
MFFAKLVPFFALVAAVSLLHGCRSAARVEVSDAGSVPEAAEWRRVATLEDQARLGDLETGFAQAIAAARRAGFGRQIAAEGALLEPGSLARAAPSPGSYRCRIIRLGPSGRGRALQSFAPYFCHVGVEGDRLSLTKQSGSERPGGYLWDDGQDRMIFIGATALGNEPVPPAYGDDSERSLVGLLERVAPFRYRLVMPRARSVATLDVLEMVPVIP